MVHTTNIIKELTPLSDKDCLYIVERHKNEFTYPMHTHDAYELNFIRNGHGLKRIVGDSVESITDLELVLIAQPNLEHTWEQGDAERRDMYEITIQFSPNLISQTLLNKNQFASIGSMLERAKQGLCFSMETIIAVYGDLEELLHCTDGFAQLLQFWHLLFRLSKDSKARTLSSGSFAKANISADSRRVQKVEDYIRLHYMDDIPLATLADIVGMTEVSFSRFFKLRTGRTLTNYLIDMRLGYASRMLVDTTQSVAEIAYQCGFNNISNFNRLFRKHKQMSPIEFRNSYQKNKVLV